MGTQADGELLARYRNEGDETAFAELVRRHLGVVYGAALRQLSGDRDAAQDAAQAAFSLLASQAERLTGHPTLAGWLYTTTRHIAGHARRERERRERREQETMKPLEDPTHPPAEWEQLRAVLDEAMEALTETDRVAVLLRFFEGLELKEVGRALGLTDNAARMRVQRALDKLRQQLHRRGIHTTSAALAGCLLAHSATAAPLALAAHIVSGTLVAPFAIPASGTFTPFGLPWITTMKTPVSCVLGALLLAGPILYQESQIHQLRAELARGAVPAGPPPLGGDPSTTALELEQLKREAAELDQLRMEVAAWNTGQGSEKRAAMAASSARLQSAEARLAAATAERDSRVLRARTVNDMKHLVLAARMFATDDKANAFPTNLVQLQGLIGDDAIRRTVLEKFEMYPQPRPIRETEPDLFLFWESVPRQLPDGQWERVYGMADGSVQVAKSPTADFSAWERERGGVASTSPTK